MNATPSTFSSPKYRPDIDGLRAMAVLSVVAFHAFPAWIRGGFIGVDIFFVISGFLISTILFENLEKGTFSFREFYARRIKRIFPALILVLTACFVFGWFTLLADEYQQLGKHMAAGAGFMANFVLWSEVGYFDNAADTKPLLHLWSLGIEEQFYIVWPLILWAAWKRKFNLLSIAILFFIVSFTLNLKGVKADPTTTFYMPHTRFWELLAGSILAWFHVYRRKPLSDTTLKIDRYMASIIYRHPTEADGATLRNLSSFLGFGLLLFGFWRIHQDIGFPGKWALVPVLGAVLIILAGAQAWINRVILSNKLVIWIGLISFPLYLWHWPLLSFARILEGETPSRNIRIAAVLIAIALAWLTFRFVERYIRHTRKCNIKMTRPLIILMMIIFGAGIYILQTLGLPNRLVRDQFSIPYETNLPFFECKTILLDFNDINLERGCHLSKPKEPVIAFIGDSHMLHYKHALWKALPDHSILMAVETSCFPFSGHTFMKEQCQEKYEKIISILEKNNSIQQVVISGYWAYLMAGGATKRGEHWRLPINLTPENAVSFQKNAHDFIDRVLNSGKKLIFMKDIPDLTFNIRKCVSERPFTLSVKRVDNCSFDMVNYKIRIAPYDQIINKILSNHPQVIVFDPKETLCDSETCLIKSSKHSYYYNGDHLTKHGAEFVIKNLLPVLKKNHPQF